MKNIYKIGRTADNDIIINESEVSRKHAIITKVNNTEFIIEDLDSANGTFVNGKRVKRKSIRLEDKLVIGGKQIDLKNLSVKKKLMEKKVEKLTNKKLKTVFKIGRSDVNDIIIKDDSISRIHATLVIKSSSKFEITDDNSSNGVKLNNKRVDRTELTKNDTLLIGDYIFNISEHIDLTQYTSNLNVVTEVNLNTISSEFNKLKELYDNYQKNKLDSQKHIKRKRMFWLVGGTLIGALLGIVFKLSMKEEEDEMNHMKILVFMSLGGVVGRIVSQVGSSTVDNKEEMMNLTDNFKIHYICPKCKSFLGNLPWENLNNQGGCPRCKTKWNKL